jgi:foldase protein PrsA
MENELLYQEAKKRSLEDNPEIKMRAQQAVKDVVVLSFLKSQISNQIQVSEEEAHRVYEQNKELFRREQDEVRASHILLSSQSQADSVYARIKKGEDFGSLAQELSLDSQSRNWGGDLGYFGLSTMHPLIAEKAFDLQVGEVSTPFETEMGYHILKVMDKKPKGSLRGFAEVRNRLINQLLAEKKRGAVTSLLDELKSKAKIEKFGWARDSVSIR